MSTPFWVRCIDARDPSIAAYLKQGDIYQACQHSIGQLKILGVRINPWDEIRFELVKGKVVKCIAPRGCAVGIFEIGRLYEVEKQATASSEWVIVGNQGSWYKDQFEEVDITTSSLVATPAADPPLPPPAIAPTPEEKPFDFDKYYGVSK